MRASEREQNRWFLTDRVRRRVGANATYRTVPSAGGRHSFETYLGVMNVEGLGAGPSFCSAPGAYLRRWRVQHGLQRERTAVGP